MFDIYVVSYNKSFLPVIYKTITNWKLLDAAKIQNTEYVFLGDMYTIPMPYITQMLLITSNIRFREGNKDIINFVCTV